MTATEDDWSEPQHRATYSPEDNTIRIYPNGVRLDDELGDEYADFKRAGYKWASKQECFVCPRWTPAAEDWALRLAGEIDDEDYSYEERAADRAERFEGYREKRSDEAGERADTFEAGPAAFGHQSRARAERQARKHDRHRYHAVSQWSKAEYWQRRTAGVISHALYKSSAHVRRGRILTLEADQRKHNKSREEYATRFRAWQKVLTLGGADETYRDQDASPAAKLAYMLANSAGGGWDYKHPRLDRNSSLYSLLTDPVDPITAREAATIWLDGKREPEDENGYVARWARHYDLRLTYERAMLAEEGGTAAAADIEPGGWIQPGRTAWQLSRGSVGQWLQVQKVNKSPATGRVTSVGVKALSSNSYDKNGKAYGPDNPRPEVIVTISVERLGEECYRAPTDEERAAFTTAKKAAKKAAPKAPPLINPTDTDAERLQAYLIVQAAEAATKNGKAPSTDPVEVDRLTQAKYSRYSGQDSIYHVAEISIDGQAVRVRMRRRPMYDYRAAGRVVVLTDKPQKPLPITWPAMAEAGCLF